MICWLSSYCYRLGGSVSYITMLARVKKAARKLSTLQLPWNWFLMIWLKWLFFQFHPFFQLSKCREGAEILSGQKELGTLCMGGMHFILCIIVRKVKIFLNSTFFVIKGQSSRLWSEAGRHTRRSWRRWGRRKYHEWFGSTYELRHIKKLITVVEMRSMTIPREKQMKTSSPHGPTRVMC